MTLTADGSRMNTDSDRVIREIRGSLF